MSAFRAALRISRRDALRAKGRTALIMVMIGLPVLVITAMFTGSATTNVTMREKLGSVLGAADARIVTRPFRTRVEQNPDGTGIGQPSAKRRERPWTPAEIGALLPGRLLRYQANVVEARLADGFDRVDVLEADLRDPMTGGMRRLVEGRFATAPGEVTVSPELVDRGVRIGDTITVWRPDRTVRVVGVAEHPNRPGILEMVALPEGLLPHQNDGNDSGWLIDTAAPVQWSDVRRLNKAGLAVQSRAVIESSDAVSSGPMDMHRLVQVGVSVLLIVTETVLLTGPAFAVGLRRRRRELAVIAAQGASARQLKAIVLADGLVLGGAAALLGAALGIGAGLLTESYAARWSDWTHGPAEVPWGPVLGVAALGVVSGLTAAVVPAIQASRQSPVQVLSGRAAVDLPGRAGRPVLGAALVLLGLAANAFALHRGTLSVLVAAVPLVFGLVALAPWLVQVTGRLAGRLPLPLRLSVRDASRHRVRTSSATAAVMAATMGVVAVGIGFQSLHAQREAERPLAVPAGTTTITAATLDEQGWAALREFARAELRGANLVSGLAATDAQGNSVTVSVAYQTVFADDPAQHRYYVPMPVGDARLLAFLQGGHDARAAAALAAGQVVVFDPSLVRDGTVELRASWDDGTTPARTLRVPAVVARAGSAAQGGALVPEPVLARAGLKAVERVLYADEVPADASRLETKLRATFGDRVFSVVQEGLDRSHLMVMLILLAAALVLVLGGTFAATGLAAADMRQDLDTLSAVGGPPLVRRLVVAAQAACVAGLGALVGLAGGTVSGIALTWPLTRSSGAELFDPGPTVIAIPWALLAWVVVGLPALAALVAGLCARTRPALARRMA